MVKARRREKAEAASEVQQLRDDLRRAEDKAAAERQQWETEKAALLDRLALAEAGSIAPVRRCRCCCRCRTSCWPASWHGLTLVGTRQATGTALSAPAGSDSFVSAAPVPTKWSRVIVTLQLKQKRLQSATVSPPDPSLLVAPRGHGSSVPFSCC